MQDSKHKSKEPPDEKEITDINSVVSSKKTSLRQIAEEILEEDKALPLSFRLRKMDQAVNLADVDMQKLFYELEVHQIELEMQNKELLLAKEQSQKSAEKYIELYDFSPSGYFTLSHEGNILDLNLVGSQLLGKERINLINSRFGFFVVDDSKPEFNRFIDTLFTTKCKASCDILLGSNGFNFPINLFLTGIVTENCEQCLITGD